MKNRMKALLKKNKLLFRIGAGLYYGMLRIGYFFYRLFYPMNPKAVLFISFMGESYSDNPRALYEYMKERPECASFCFYWVFKAPQRYVNNEELKGATLIRYGSSAYYKACAAAKYWVSNARMRNELIKRKGQIYLQTWHGTPFKRLGYDINVKEFRDIGGDRENLLRNYRTDAKRYDYMLSASDFYSEKIGSAFGLHRIGKQGIFLEYGYPRNDVLYEENQDRLKQIKKELNLDDGRKIILYAPTFRERELGENGYEYRLRMDLERLKREFADEYVFLFRLHYYVSQSLDLSDYKGFLYDMSSYDDISRLYLISDALITDYSSVFFDYAVLKRPILFYMYDLEQYHTFMHDFYLSLEELPGEIAYNEEELIAGIRRLADCGTDFESFNRRFNPYPYGASARTVEKLLSL